MTKSHVKIPLWCWRQRRSMAVVWQGLGKCRSRHTQHHFDVSRFLPNKNTEVKINQTRKRAQQHTSSISNAWHLNGMVNTHETAAFLIVCESAFLALCKKCRSDLLSPLVLAMIRRHDRCKSTSSSRRAGERARPSASPSSLLSGKLRART